jgi:hypothetical protein
MFCSNCGTKNIETDKFCRNCGKGTGADADATTTSPTNSEGGLLGNEPPRSGSVNPKKIRKVISVVVAGVLLGAVGLVAGLAISSPADSLAETDGTASTAESSGEKNPEPEIEVQEAFKLASNDCVRIRALRDAMYYEIDSAFADLPTYESRGSFFNNMSELLEEIAMRTSDAEASAYVSLMSWNAEMTADAFSRPDELPDGLVPYIGDLLEGLGDWSLYCE